MMDDLEIMVIMYQRSIFFSQAVCQQFGDQLVGNAAVAVQYLLVNDQLFQFFQVPIPVLVYNIVHQRAPVGQGIVLCVDFCVCR